MRRTTIVFFVIVGIAAAIAVFALFGPGKVTAMTGLIGSEKTPSSLTCTSRRRLPGTGYR